MQPWKTKVICAGKYRPRQFEYHPQHEDVVLFGTLKGEAVVADVGKNSVLSSISRGLAHDRHDSILGLCWLKRAPTRFAVGSSHGYLRLCDAGDFTSRASAGLGYTVPMDSPIDGGGGRHTKLDLLSMGYDAAGEGVGRMGAGGLVGEIPGGGHDEAGLGEMKERGSIVKEYESFEKLTSVHINASDSRMLASGYSYDVRLFDLETGTVVCEFKRIHEDHINISRFANHSPFVFATSSFDRTVKAWDSRMRKKPIYTCHSDNGNVMLCFSPDDVFLLTSAIDNEVKQYLALDGRLHMHIDMPKTGLEDNFTRSYYTSSGRLILSGSSEEQTMRLHCAQTGNLIHSTEMYPGRKHSSLYVQSLSRGDPHHDFQFSVLVNYRDTAYPLEIVHVDMLKGNNGEDLSSVMSYTSSSSLASDLSRVCLEKEGADVCLVARDRSCYLAHSAIISCRSSVLRGLLSMAGAGEGRGVVGRGSGLGESGREAGGACGTCEGKGLAMVLGAGERRHDGMVGAGAGQGGRGDMMVVCLPWEVCPSIVPVVMEFLYTDCLELNPANRREYHEAEYTPPNAEQLLGTEGWGHDRSKGTTRKQMAKDSSMEIRTQSPLGGGVEWDRHGLGGSAGSVVSIQGKVGIYEKVLEASRALGLRRLAALVEWECRGLVSTEMVVPMVTMALRQGARQLLKYCVHYLVTHMHIVNQLHGQGCLPQPVQEEVC
ncbi:unnamed protein product [Discosporangium mesarthrocarpum]